MDIQEYLTIRRESADTALDEALPSASKAPESLHEAMRYSVLAGGKRVRPILAMAAAEAVGADGRTVMPYAVALEMIHTYSLIHDDLPAMDDDDMRRGKASVHKAFDEATAILAGDALLTLAFERLSLPATVRLYRPERLLGAIRELAEAAGCARLVAGQAMDLAYEGKEVDKETVLTIMRNKTGALIRASVMGGAILAGAERSALDALGRYGANLGMVFQIRDDLLDLEGDAEKLGKAVGKDMAKGKATLARLAGAQEARNMMKNMAAEGLEALKCLGDAARPLALLADYVVERST